MSKCGTDVEETGKLACHGEATERSISGEAATEKAQLLRYTYQSLLKKKKDPKPGGVTLYAFDGDRSRGRSRLVKQKRAQGGCLGTKSR